MKTSAPVPGIARLCAALMRRWRLLVAAGLALSFALLLTKLVWLAPPLLMFAGLCGAIAGAGAHFPLDVENPYLAIRPVLGVPRGLVIVGIGASVVLAAWMLLLNAASVAEQAPWRAIVLYAAACACFGFGLVFAVVGKLRLSMARDRINGANFQQKHQWREAARQARGFSLLAMIYAASAIEPH